MFASTVLAEQAPALSVLVLEKATKPLAKVRVSGGGRCNLTHQCSDIREFIKNYPRGGRELIGPFNRFGPTETAEWFESHGVSLRTFPDGRIFPESDRSESVIDLLLKHLTIETPHPRFVGQASLYPESPCPPPALEYGKRGLQANRTTSQS